MDARGLRHHALVGVVSGLLVASCALKVEQKPPSAETTPEGVRPEERVNLAAAGLATLPAFPEPGEAVVVEVQVRNRAPVTARRVAVTVLDGNEQIGTGRLDVAASSVATLRLPWRAASSGRHRLTAIVDPARELFERDRADDVVSLDVVVAPLAAGADFAVTDLRIVRVDGGTQVVRATVQNNGSADASAPLVVHVDGRVIGMKLVGSLRPGASVAVDVPWPTESPGRRLTAEINPRQRMHERRPDDNLIALDLAPPVDLRVEGLTVHTPKAEPAGLQRVTISFRVVNAGATDIIVPFRTRVFPGNLRIDSIPPALESFDLVTPRLAAGQTLYVSRSVDLPFTDTTVRVEVDADNAIAEADETNNVATWHFTSPAPAIGHWVSIGPRRIQYGLGSVGRLHSIAVHPINRSIIYVGAPSGVGWSEAGPGVWKTVDGGASWQPVTDSLPTLSTAGLAVHPSDPSRVYVVTSTAGVFSSGDGGTSWTQIAADTALNARAGSETLLIDPTNPDVLYLTTGDGVRRSADRGVRWPVSLPGNARSLVMSRSNPRLLYASLASSDANVAGIYVTSDGGGHWTLVGDCPGARLPTNDADTKITLALAGDTIYAGYLSPTAFKIYRTSGVGCSVGGQSRPAWEFRWQASSSTYPAFWNSIYADPVNRDHVYATGTEFWSSRDGAASFSRQTAPHADHHGFAMDPLDSRIIYTVSDGGIYRSTNYGRGSWTFIGEGIRNVEFYDIANAATDPRLVIGGTQDNGTIKYDDGNTVWAHILGGDGATVDIDRTNPRKMYAMHQTCDELKRSTDSGGDFSRIGGGLSHQSYPHWQVHPGDPSTLLASCGVLWWGRFNQRPLPPPSFGSVEVFSGWRTLFRPPSGNVVRTTVDSSVGYEVAGLPGIGDVRLDLIYAGTDDGLLYAVPAPGTFAWRAVFTHPEGMPVYDIEVDPNDPATVYVAFAATSGEGRLYRLRRSTPLPATMTASPMTEGLPDDLVVRTVAVDPFRPLTVYAGTNRGVYQGRSNDEGLAWTWTPYNMGLPLAVDIADLEVHPTSRVMRAATYGRGAYEVMTGQQ